MSMDAEIPLGTKRVVQGRLRVYYHGYWIKAYEVPANTLEQKKRLIEALTRRLFNHVEHGLNVPGTRLDEARAVYDAETDPARRRVKGAMLAGALFNRSTAIFEKLVELQELGVVIQPDNALMQECGRHLQEAFALGKLVLHRSGEEGIDELWGEPLKAFSFPVEQFYDSRYVKIAHTMRAIDLICGELCCALEGLMMFLGVEPLVRAFAAAAKNKSETLRTDPEIFDVWTDFVVAGERLAAFRPLLPRHPEPLLLEWAEEGEQLLHETKAVVFHITRARVPMPRTARELVARFARFRTSCGLARDESRSSSPPPRHSEVRALAPSADAPRPRPLRVVQPAVAERDSRAAS